MEYAIFVYPLLESRFEFQNISLIIVNWKELLTTIIVYLISIMIEITSIDALIILKQIWSLDIYFDECICN